MKEKPLVNRVAKSGIITLNLEDYYPQEEILVFDIKDYLFRGLILREKDFRAVVAEHDWTQYQDKNLVIYCSTDAIVPIWAYQLATIEATPYARQIIHGSVEDFVIAHYYSHLQALDLQNYADQRIVIKGCSDKPVPISAYMELARLLTPVAKKIMYGEPCSMVPLYKKK
ncbi:MAG: DUF2480 family protein [Aureispira sp.]